MPLIALLFLERGAKFVTLVHRLTASRDTVSATLKHLMAADIVARNPGYGHPMRPEYILTRFGQRLGPSCVSIVEVATRLGIEEMAFKKWPMPVALAVGQGADRFSSLSDTLGRVTPRALTSALRALDHHEIVVREITEGWPPHPRYELAEAGELLMPGLDGLYRAARG